MLKGKEKKEFENRCKSRAQEKLRPYIPKAIEGVQKIDGLSGSRTDITKVIQLAGEFYDLLRTVDKPTDLELLLKFNPETAIMSDMLLSDIHPIVEEIRLRLFGKKSPPFPNNIENSVTWIINESKNVPESVVKRPKLSLPEFIKLMKETIPSYTKRKEKFLPGHMISFRIEKLTIPYRDLNGNRKRMPILKGTKLFHLAINSKQIAQNTDFPQDSLITFILTGIRPYLPSFRIKTGIRKFGYVQIDFHRGMDYEEFLYLHRKLKSFFKRKNTLNEKHFEVYRLVSKKGGIPQKNKSDFWAEVLEEWNNSHPDDKYGSANNLRITYNRIIKSVTIPQSFSSES
jgi:hypothetical protein